MQTRLRLAPREPRLSREGCYRFAPRCTFYIESRVLGVYAFAVDTGIRNDSLRIISQFIQLLVIGAKSITDEEEKMRVAIFFAI